MKPRKMKVMGEGGERFQDTLELKQGRNPAKRLKWKGQERERSTAKGKGGGRYKGGVQFIITSRLIKTVKVEIYL